MEDKELLGLAYQEFKRLVAEGTSMEDSFYTVVKQVLSESGDIIYDIGYSNAFELIKEIAQHELDEIEEKFAVRDKYTDGNLN